MSGAGRGALFEEHVLLGASFEDADGEKPARAAAYLGEDAAGALDDGAVLCDLSGSCYLLASGAVGCGLASAALACELPAVGECAFGACLAGDGALVGVPLLLRTGTDELVVLDATERAPVLEGWLTFLAGIEAQGVRPYDGASLEDAHGSLVPLLLAGPAAARVLEDYLAEGATLPAAGRVAQLSLDRIGALVAHVRLGRAAEDAYLVFVPGPLARVLWRSLLSFTEVSPIGHAALRGLCARLLPWGELTGSAGQVVPTRRQLVDWGLLRVDDGFVGARALRARG